MDRSVGIGASEIAAVCGLSPWSSPLGVYLSKVDGQTQKENKAMRWGKLLEDVVAQAYEEISGAEVCHPVNPTEVHPKKPIFFASLDRIAIHPDWEKPRILEIKTSREKTPEWGEDGSDCIPIYYYLQVQHQMEVTGMSDAMLACLFSGQDLVAYHIKKSDEIIQRAWGIAETFWVQHVVPRSPPDPTWRTPEDHELSAWTARYTPELVLPLNRETQALLCEYKEVAREISRLEARKASLKGRILGAMGEAQELRSVDGSVSVHRTKVTRSEYTSPKVTYHTLTIRGINDVERVSRTEVRDREQGHDGATQEGATAKPHA